LQAKPSSPFLFLDFKLALCDNLVWEDLNGRRKMKSIIPNKSSVRRMYIRTWFVYTTKFGRISEPTSDITELQASINEKQEQNEI
jgi:hypothetical protein